MRPGTPAGAVFDARAIDSLPVATLLHRGGAVLAANRALRELLGDERFAQLDQTGGLAVHLATEDRDSIRRRWRQALAGAEYRLDADLTLDGIDGTPLRLRSHLRHVALADGPALIECLVGIDDLVASVRELDLTRQHMRTAHRQACMTYWRWSFAEQRVTHWSEDWEGIMGSAFYSEGLDYERMASVIHADDRTRVLRSYAAADEAHCPFSIEYRVVRLDGEVRHVREFAEIELDSDGEPAAHVGVVRDIDEEKRLRLALRESERRYRDFIADTNEGVWRIEFRTPIPVSLPAEQQVERMLDDGYFAEANDVLARMYGHASAADIVGRVARDVYLGSDGGNRALMLLYVRSGYRLNAVESEEIASRVGAQWFLNNVTGIVEDGLLLGEWGTQTDITELKRAEQARLAEEQRFRDFADTAADWFWESGDDGRVCFLSEGFAGRAGIAAARLLDRTWREFLAETGAEQASEELLGSLEEHSSFRGMEVAYAAEDGSARVARINGKPIFGPGGTPLGYRGSGADITAARHLAERLAYQASHDSLTGLVGRDEFEKRVERLLESARGNAAEHALCYLDLDQFKVVNDTCGHAAGDELLRRLGSLLRQHARSRDTVARLGGDEFAVLLEHCTLEQARHVANELRLAVADARFTWEGKTFCPGTSIGLVPLNGSSGSVGDVLRVADAACYMAKDEGRNRVHVYHEEDQKLAVRHGEMQWVARLHRAFDEHAFVLHQQPIIALAPGSTTTPARELLLRMVDSDGTPVMPGAFLPAAERYNLAARLDRWVVDAAFAWLGGCEDSADELTFVNLSAQSLADEDFIDFVGECANRHRVRLQRVCFELTETAVISNLTRAIAIIGALREAGCRFALDDFGSGVCSFAYLRSLPVDFLKIDGLFVRDIATDPVALELVSSINDIGHVMGKRTIAEFVEDEPVLARLREIGVDFAQGYAVGRPRPLEHRVPVTAMHG